MFVEPWATVAVLEESSLVKATHSAALAVLLVEKSSGRANAFATDADSTNSEARSS